MIGKYDMTTTITRLMMFIQESKGFKVSSKQNSNEMGGARMIYWAPGPA